MRRVPSAAVFHAQLKSELQFLPVHQIFKRFLLSKFKKKCFLKHLKKYVNKHH